MKKLCATLGLLALAGCASTPAPPDGAGTAAPTPAIADTREARLAALTAAELERRAREEPAALETVYPELVALSLALAGVEAPEAESVAEGAPGPAAGLAPPPEDLAGARSLLHAIHLASYRGEETAARGWRELSAEHPELAALEPRLERVDIPGRGEFLRLKAGPFTTWGGANEVCDYLRGENWSCAVMDFTGDSGG